MTPPRKVAQKRRATVRCDDKCGAFEKPITLDEYKAALKHWQSHGLMFGCAHGC